MQVRSNSDQAGFTLIEILIAITILAVCFAIALLGYCGDLAATRVNMTIN